MKKRLLFNALSFLVFCCGLQAQITLIDPATEGGFENGSTFAANNWTVAQGSSTTRVWYLGTGQTGYSGARAAFIGDSPTTVGSTTSSRPAVHLYKSVTIPSGAENIVLSFKYKQTDVDHTYDYLTVFLNGNTPVGATAQTTGALVLVDPSTTSTYSVFTVVTVTVPNSFAGTTNNLIFSFTADGFSPDAYGAIDDVSLTYVMPACPSPSALNYNSLAVTSSNFTWTPNGPATAWDIFYGITPLTVPNATTVPTATSSVSSYSIVGLSPSTPYSVYVRSNCGVGNLSSWTPVKTFTTPCTSITSLPYSEGFDAVSLPPCWTTNLISGSTNWKPDNSNDAVPAPRNGANFAGKDYTNSSALLISPLFNLGFLGSNQARVNLWIYRSADNDPSDIIRIHLNTSNSLAGATQILQIFPNITVAPTESADGWYNYTANIPVSFNSGGPFYVLVEGTTSAGFSSYGLGFDDFVIELGPTCFPPTALTASNLTATSGSISWMAPLTGTPMDYEWEVRTAGALGSGTLGLVANGNVTAPTTSVTLTGLTASTNYTVYVRSHCGGSDYSTIVSSMFMTPCQSADIVVTGNVRCGIGSTNLTATSTNSSAVINWYNSPSGGASIATGSVFTTPTLTNNTTYYATSTAGLTNSNVGKASTLGADGTNTPGAYLIFDAQGNFVLNSVVIYPFGTGTGTVVIALQNSLGTTLQTATVTAIGSSSVVAQTVPLNFNITPGTGYRLTYLSTSGGITALYRDFSGTTFPYAVPGVVSITNGSLSGYYYYFYNWSVSSGCESPRAAVTATVGIGTGTPPTLTAASSSAVICSGLSAVLTASTSANSYTWSANAGSANTISVSVTPTVTTNYTVTVSNGNCTISAAVSVSVNPCTGIEELDTNSINVYPNPANDILNVSIANGLITNSAIEVFDAIGKLVIKETLSNATTTINVSKLEDGVYFYKIINNNQDVKIGKFIKQ